MEVKNIEFQFKGSRDYIHGTDMFNVLLETAGNRHLPAGIRFVIHDFVRTPVCLLYLLESKEELSKLPEIRVHCQYSGSGALHWLALQESTVSQAAGGRYAYDEEKVISLCRLENESIVLAGRGPFSFIENIVAMNKHLHQQLFPEQAGKWIFSRIDLDTLPDARVGLALQLRHNMNHRLTKSDILIKDVKVGDLYFSLVRT